MERTKWFYHPISIFIFSNIALMLSLFLYIYWYIEASTGLESLVKKLNIDKKQFLAYETWVVVLVLSILVGIILAGIFIIFVYNRKIFQLYRLQNNFINNFTHELKTPVTSLKLYLETFTKYELSRADQLKYLEFMIHDVSRLSENINRILNLSKLESKSYKGEFIVVKMVDIIVHFVNKNSHFFRNCIIEVHQPPVNDFLYPINAPLFEMLLNNLMSNAVKFNKSEEPRIDIRFETRKMKFIIHFQDNGIGIEKNELKQVFKKFYQVGRSDDMTAKGSGLGLYLVQSIAKLHKSKVMVDSAGIGKGSEFTLIFPSKRE